MKQTRSGRILSPLRGFCAVACAFALLLGLAACAPVETVMGWLGGKWVDDKPYEGYKLSKFIKLGEYKGVEADFVTQEEYLSLYMKDIFSQNRSFFGISDDPAREEISLGDMVYFDFEGSAPGLSAKAKEGMKGTTLLYVGSGAFIPGFEDQMIGQPRDVEFTVSVTFPEDYGMEGSEQAELNGKDVTFKCTAYKIGGESEEITDEGVEILAAMFGEDFTTVAEFDAVLREDMGEELPFMVLGYNKSLAFDAAMANAEVIKLPPKEQRYWDERLADNAAGYGMSPEEFAMNSGFESAAAFRDERVVCELFLYAVAQNEGITVTDEDMAALMDEIRAGGYQGTDAELYSDYGGKGYLLRHLMSNKATDFILENAKGVPAEPEAPEEVPQEPAEE